MKKVELNPTTLTYEFKEQIIQLRVNLLFTGADKKVVLVTSSMSGEGKSTISLELAKSIAESGKKTLIINADMRKSDLAAKVKHKGQLLGLSHLLSGQNDIEEILYQVENSPLYMIFGGRIPPNPSELLASKRMEKLIDWAKDYFDTIIIDCPPVGMVADALTLAPLADGALVIVKAGKVPRKAVQSTVKMIKRTECPILGVVINQTGKQYKKYYGKKYGYGYGYGVESTEEIVDKEVMEVTEDKMTDKSST